MHLASPRNLGTQPIKTLEAGNPQGAPEKRRNNAFPCRSISLLIEDACWAYPSPSIGRVLRSCKKQHCACQLPLQRNINIAETRRRCNAGVESHPVEEGEPVHTVSRVLQRPGRDALTFLQVAQRLWAALINRIGSASDLLKLLLAGHAADSKVGGGDKDHRSDTPATLACSF